MNERLKKQLDFMLELDKMKSIYRQTYVLHEDRKENDAEHSWHLAILAFMLEEYAAEPIDTLKVIKMVLLHDVVEIDAGDTYLYDEEGYKSKAEREEKAAQRIFGLLPDDQRDELRGLFEEFEANETPEARFAHVMDNFQPLLLNNANDGGDWRAHRVSRSQVWGRQAKTELGSAEIWEYTRELIEENIRKKNIKEDK